MSTIKNTKTRQSGKGMNKIKRFGKRSQNLVLLKSVCCLLTVQEECIVVATALIFSPAETSSNIETYPNKSVEIEMQPPPDKIPENGKIFIRYSTFNSPLKKQQFLVSSER